MNLIRILLCLFISSVSFAGVNIASMTMDEIQAIISNPFGNYYNFKIKGVCSWLTMQPPFIHVTPYVQHYQPDLVVSVYPTIGQNPFDEANTVIDPALKSLGDAQIESMMGTSSGEGQSGLGKGDNTDKFYEVDVIGSPGAQVVQAAMGLFSLPPATTPYVPYYSSQLDKYLWHDPALEISLHPSAYIPFKDNEGSKFAPWGSLYPRYGLITQVSSYKSAAMIALRGIHIATRSNQSHVYNSAPKNCGQDCSVIATPDINDNDSVKFQLIYPQTETHFDPDDIGHDDITDISQFFNTYKEDVATKGNNAFVWLAWRKYEGCVQHPGKLINVIKF
jgi:integrating conjugative element protein (TIGR03756 family)